MSNADPLDAPLLLENELPSTMDAARERAQRGASGEGRSGTLILARRQTGGRGRYGNRWVSPPGGLYLSMILRPAEGAAAAPWASTVVPWLPLSAALSMYRVVADHLPAASARLGIKWPNDLYLHEKKISGVLVETGRDRADQPFAIVGAGLNVAQAAGDLPPTATSLAAAGLAPCPSLEQLAAGWRAHFFALPAPVDPLRSVILPCLLGRGAAVTIGWREEEQTDPGKRGTTSGRLIGLGLQAEAILEDTQGKTITVSEGHLLNWSTWSGI